MKTDNQRLNYQELELIPFSGLQPKNTLQIVSSTLQKLGSYLLQSLIQGNRLRIWQTKDRFDQTWWNIYDPTTTQFLQLASEEEVRVWLDQDQYQRTRTLARHDQWLHTRSPWL